MRAWQQGDPTLQEHLKAAREVGVIAKGEKGMVLDKGFLYLLSEEGEKLLAVPKKWRSRILSLAHDIPMSGHLAQDKMRSRIKCRFWWPDMDKDIEEYCQTCPECQKTQIKPKPGTPLMPMPLIDQPFQRIGIDIVGPLM